MKFKTFQLLSVSLLNLLLAFGAFAQDFLIDDFSDISDSNSLGQSWLYYDDNMGVGENDRPQAAPGTTPSVINVNYELKNREAFGNPDDTFKIKDYTFTLDTASEFATMPFTFGEEWEANGYTAKSFVGIITMMASKDSFIDLTYATGIKFKTRSRNPLHVIFRVETFDIIQDSTYGFYQYEFLTSDSWENVEINFADLRQPTWAKKVDFDQTKISQINWVIQKEDNPSTSSDTFDIDDIFIMDFNNEPPPELLIDDFERGYSDTKIGTHWYFFDDSNTDNGNSKINNAGSENQFIGSYETGNESSYAGVVDFTLRSAYAYPYAGVGFSLDNCGDPIDLTGATSVKFDIKGSRRMNVTFQVEQSTITNYDFYSKMISVDTSWTTVKVNLSSGNGNLVQELFGPKIAFEIDKITALSWVYLKHENPSAANSGIFYIDNIKILGTPADLHPPFPPIHAFPEWKSKNNSLTPTFSWHKKIDALSYNLQVSKTSDFSSLFVIDESITAPDTEYISPELDYGTTYYVRINVTTDSGTSRWSATNIFTTTYDTPPPPSLISPVNNADTVPLSTLLLWNSSIGANTYQLQISFYDTFNTTIIDTNTLTDTVFTLSSLDNGTTFYWRVKATNLSGTSNWSATRKFTTIQQTPGTPVLLSPTNDTNEVDTSLTLEWESAARAVSYTLQISTVSSFSSFVLNQSGITSTTSNEIPLSSATQYYWRVRAENTGGSGSWSSVANFTTVYPVPEIPQLSSPADKATSIPVSTTLSWNVAANAETYDLQVSNDKSFAATIVDLTGLTATSSEITSLARETVYYWRLRGVNPGGPGSWSSIRSFTTIIEVPGIPVLCMPVNEAINIPVSTQLVWNKVQGVSSYGVQLSTDSSFTDYLVNQENIEDTLLNVENLPDSTVIFWRVNATNEGGTCGWSVTGTFTTIVSVPETPVLLLPEEDSEKEEIDQTFSWSTVTGAALYSIIIATDSSFDNLVLDSNDISDTTITIKGLVNDTKYYWKVRAANEGGNGPWSAQRSFSTIIALPQKVSLVISDSIDTVKTSEKTLIWHSSEPEVERYLIEIADNENMENAIIDTVTDTSKLILDLSDGTQYWWRVCAGNEAGIGEYSEKGTFVVCIPASVRLPQDFSVNAYGAGRMSRIIKYALPKKCQVKASLYNLRGSLVKKLIDSKQEVGIYHIRMPKLTTGTYYLRFTAGDYQYSRKFIFTK